MLTDLERERMEIAKLTENTTNCVGTILYVLGVSDEDTYIGSGEQRWEDGIVDDLLEKMTKVETPQEGGVLVIRSSRGRVEHMGIIVQEEPPMVYHRGGTNRWIEPNVPMEDVVSGYGKHPIVEIYEPNRIL